MTISGLRLLIQLGFGTGERSRLMERHLAGKLVQSINGKGGDPSLRRSWCCDATPQGFKAKFVTSIRRAIG